MVIDLETLVVDSTATLDMPSIVSLSQQDIKSIYTQIMVDTVQTNSQVLLDVIQQLGCSLQDLGGLMNRVGVLVVSPRAADADIACSLARLLLQHVKRHGTYLGFGTEEQKSQGDPVPYFINQHMMLLERHLKVAENSLLDACQKAPLNGVLLVLDGILRDLDPSMPDYTQIGMKAIELCVQACHLTSPVCTSASPEGYLPPGTTGDKTKMAQLLLRHCFRTIKNASSCIVLLVTRMNASQEFVKEIGDLLSRLLLSVRHKGAFASLYESFSDFCCFLSRNDAKKSMVQSWLDLFLDQITSLQVSVTRRSAGLPSAILAVITSSKSEKERSLMLDQVIKRCFEIIEQEEFEHSDAQQQEDLVESQRTGLDLPQVHALNIIRFSWTN